MQATLSLRPEQITLSRGASAEAGTTLPVQVLNRIFLGEHTEYLVRSAALGDVLVLVPRRGEARETDFEPGETAHASWAKDAGLVLENERTQAKQGDQK